MAWDDTPPTSQDLARSGWDSSPPTSAELAQTKPAPGFWEQAGRSAVNQLPMTGALVGGLAGTPLDAVTGPAGTAVGAGIGGYLGTAARNAINSYISPEQAPQTMGQVVGQPLLGGAQAAANELTGAAIAPYASGFLKNLARSKAMSATGATGKEAAEMLADNPNLPDQLLDRKIVSFGNSPARVAEKAQQAIDDAEETKQTIVNQLPDVTVDRRSIVNQIKGKMASLSGDESKKGLISKLQSAADDVQEQIDNKAENVTAQLGNKIPNVSNLKLNYGEPQIQTVNTQPSSNFNPYNPDFDVPVSSVEQSGSIQHPEIPLKQSETVRKGWDANAKWDSSTDVPTRDAAKVVANAYRGAAEDAISGADPQLGSAYKAAKRTQQILIPVQEAAEKRASTLNQSPLGGLADTTAGLAAAAAVPGALPAKALAVGTGVASKRLLFPRLPSMTATLANQGSKMSGALPGAMQIASPQYGLMASPPAPPALPPSYSTIPGRNGQ